MDNFFAQLVEHRGTTTEWVESLLQERVATAVTYQKQVAIDDVFPAVARAFAIEEGIDCMERESFLYSERNRFTISRNSVLILPAYLPESLLGELQERRRGIGEVIRTNDLKSTRSLMSCGYIRAESALTLTCRSVQFDSETVQSMIPYKLYGIQFAGFAASGLVILEYFNARLSRFMRKGGARHDSES